MTQRRSSGFVLGLLVAALAVASIAALALTAKRFEDQTQRAWMKNTADLLASQASTIERAILRCGEAYPSGLNNDPAAPASTKMFPASSGTLAGVRCPGAAEQAAQIFSGRDGAFVYQLPGVDFGPWTFSNTSAGLIASIEAKSQRAIDATRAAARQSEADLRFDGHMAQVVITPAAAPGTGSGDGTSGAPPATQPPPASGGAIECGSKPKQTKPPMDHGKYAELVHQWNECKKASKDR
ncbi:hypothetical protein [Methylibium petroleiphilum]|uniref:Uncharacterized protein n=1 Tax=Methylibium petroleiphilum (strain ATCC BAA-1232 / LMG 22953 / PM1) TaxID=420662 RepID=A2SNQ0_METPP|nr:hypothetical protein [Methylibium petroleiphilum]ABM97189.1 hypothetical protein Mpe_B0414 [Methylibium petroleiphilum PM1]